MHKIIVSTRCILWILLFSIRYAATHREILDVNLLSGKPHQLASPNLQDAFNWRLASQGLKLASF